MKDTFDRLIARHRELDKKIDAHRRRPHGRSPEIGRLKRLRLAIKDEIQGLRSKLPREAA
ncbi:YdcH family protein [Parasphingopyxis algicola]|uniref:YdcH family protein n=1 Tax=Parasphingopyxis algicola TaxID=2026624 RepID=UPI0015A26946|nr:YdcH family protein [Parasphingopyxis algicola]QLC25227.1 YdcH family protein [Parasphingopyxis algicola]